MIKFQCNNCSEKFSVPENQADKKGKCPNCKHMVFVLGPDDSGSFTGRSGLEAKSGVSGIDSSLFEIPQKTKAAGRLMTQQDIPDKDIEGL